MEKLLQPDTQIYTKEKTSPDIGLTGLGWVGKNRMEEIAGESAGNIAFICDNNEKGINESLRMIHEADLPGSIDVLLDKEEVKGVVIATPTYLHASQCIQALKKGKAVYCQKPLGITVAETREVINAAKEADKLLSVDLPYRHNQAVKAVYDVIRSGELGHIFSVELVFHTANAPDLPWFYNASKAGGGCLMYQGIHLIDVALWCLDFPVIYYTATRMFAQGKLIPCVNGTIEDYFSARIDVADNTMVNIGCSWNLSAGGNAVIQGIFYGTKGAVSFRNVGGSMTDFIAEKYSGNTCDLLVSGTDNWMEKPAKVWAGKLANNDKYSPETEEMIFLAEIMDRLYRR